MCPKIVLFALTTIFLINSSQCARILIHCPFPSYSHQVIYQPIIKELSLRGHEVVSITTDPINDPTLVNLTEISVRFTYETFSGPFFIRTKKELGIAQTKFISDMIKPILWGIFDAQLSYPKVKKLIEDPKEHFDLVIIEWYATSLAGYMERFKCPLIGLMSAGPDIHTHLSMGNSINPSYYADMMLSFSEPTTFYERVYSSLYNLWVIVFFHDMYYSETDKLVKKHFGENIASVEDLERRASFVLTNSHPALHKAKPIVPTIIEIAGINRKSKKPLPKDLQEYLDNSTNGVIYFSFGSNVKGNLIPKEKRDIFIETFKDLPYNVVWKFETEELPGKPENVKISKWLPQPDVLYHPNVKLFITQGGIQSWEDAVHGHVPLIGFPFFADQFWNVDRMEKLGIGIKMDFEDFNKETLTNAIKTIINDKSYYKNIEKLSAILNDQPMKPLDKAIYWIEFVLRHGDVSVFRSPTMTMPWYQYFLVDVIIFFITCFTVIFGLIFFITKKILRWTGLTKKIVKEKTS